MPFRFLGRAHNYVINWEANYSSSPPPPPPPPPLLACLPVPSPRSRVVWIQQLEAQVTHQVKTTFMTNAFIHQFHFKRANYATRVNCANASAVLLPLPLPPPPHLPWSFVPPAPSAQQIQINAQNSIGDWGLTVNSWRWFVSGWGGIGGDSVAAVRMNRSGWWRWRASGRGGGSHSTQSRSAADLGAVHTLVVGALR